MRTAELRETVEPQSSTDRSNVYVKRLNRLTEREPLRTLRRSVEAFQRDSCTLWASALTYTTSLSLVPILAVALSAVKGLVGMDRIKPLVARYLAVNSPQIADQLLSFVGNINAKELGAMGGAALLVTVVLTLGTIEQSFNNVFHVEHARSWLRKFTDYLSVTFTMPLVLVAALGINSEVVHRIPMLPGVAKAAAFVPLWIGFLFLYLFFPNTRVRWQAAAIGGLVAAFLLRTGQWGFVRFQVGAAKYQAIYGAVASVPILLTWIYLSWVIVLYGAVLTAAIQGIEGPLEFDDYAPNITRVAALLAVLRAGERMRQKNSAHPCTAVSVASELGVPQKLVQLVLEKLRHGGIVVESTELSSDRAAQLVLARDTSAIPLVEVLKCVDTGAPRGNKEVGTVLDELFAAEHERLGTLTVNDLVNGRLAVDALHQPEEVRRERQA
jgi:membrane protein